MAREFRDKDGRVERASPISQLRERHCAALCPAHSQVQDNNGLDKITKTKTQLGWDEVENTQEKPRESEETNQKDRLN